MKATFAEHFFPGVEMAGVQAEQGPALRMGWLFSILLAVMGTLGLIILTWAGGTLIEIREATIRQEGQNEVLRGEIGAIKVQVEGLVNDRYTAEDGRRDRVVQEAFNTEFRKRLEAVEMRVLRR